MSTTSGGPNIVTSGLVLHLDAANEKSFRGIPTTNLVQPWATSSVLPLGYGYNQYEYNAELVDPPIRGTQFDNVKWIKFTKNLGTNGRSGFLSLSGLNTGTTYMWSTHVYTNDSRVTALSMGTDNNGVSFTVTGSAYNASNSGSLQRISCSFKSVSGGVLHGIRGGSTDAVGSIWYMVGSQVEDNTQASQVVFGSRGATVATGGGWADRTVNANHGELLNGVTYNSENGGSLVFDGTNDYIDLGNKSELAFTNGIFTLEALIYVSSSWTSGNQYPNLLSKGATAGWDTDGWSLFVFRDWPNPNQFSWGIGIRNNSPTPTTNIITRAAFTPNKYIHIMAAINGSGTTLRLYENGSEITNGSQTINPASNSTNVLIGRDNNGTSFPGRVAFIKIYNRALSAQEVLQNYNAQKSRFGLP